MAMDQQIAAIFDVDGTLVSGVSMEARFISYLWRRGELGPRELLNAIGGAGKAARAGRSPFWSNKGYLRGKNPAKMQFLARDCFEDEILPQVMEAAVARLHWHQNAGHFVMLLSGGLDILLEPLAEHLGVTARIGVDLEIKGNRLTGDIVGAHPYGVSKADCLSAVNRIIGFDLKRSFAYANHHTDRFLLAMVGNPIAANPDAGLRRIALSRGWMTEDFGDRIEIKGVYDRV
jgi:HAD superfamily hydrolase (TIGR01490 family)